MESKTEDVKKENQNPSADKDVKETAKAPSTDADLVFEGDKRSIPYERFREKNEETKALRRELEKMKTANEVAINEALATNQAYYESEIAKLQRMQNVHIDEDPTIYDDTSTHVDNKIKPLLDKISGLESMMTSMRAERETDSIKSKLQSLKAVYPDMEEEHALVVKKAKPDWTIEECAEYSHKYFEDRVKSKFDTMMAKKKEAAKKPIFTEMGNLNIEPGERPKTFAEAKKKVMEYARMLDQRG